jgi:hypothetical protein
MLADPKSSAFTENFTGQWLSLRQLGEMPPDPEKNQIYYEDKLEEAMRRETHLFFSHLLQENRSILEFIDSDYIFLNSALARHYGIPDVDDDEFRKVTLSADTHRGGLLGHGSILTATSNGIETQPVIRGIWVLENLLGTPPNPPPPDVEPIEPDTRGVATIRQLMEKHRKTQPVTNVIARLIRSVYRWKTTITLVLGETVTASNCRSILGANCPTEPRFLDRAESRLS